MRVYGVPTAAKAQEQNVIAPKAMNKVTHGFRLWLLVR